MKKIRVAVCFYGQPRTAEYCHPWISQAFQFSSERLTRLWNKKRHWDNNGAEYCSFEIDYFCDLKNQISENNTLQKVKIEKIDNQNLLKISTLYNSKKLSITDKTIDEKIRETGPFFSPMFSSICRSVFLKQQYELENNFTYDWVFVTRYDVLPGSHIDTLKTYVQDNGVQPLQIYGGHTSNLRFPDESLNRAGFNDFFFWGDSFSIDTLSSKLYCTWAVNNRRQMYVENNLGPNTYLLSSLNECGLTYEPTYVGFCVARQSSDLSRPILESWDYHQRFWIDNHQGMTIINKQKEQQDEATTI